MHRYLCTGGPALKIFQNNANSSSMKLLIRILPDAPSGLKKRSRRQVSMTLSSYRMPSTANFKRIDSVLGTPDGDVYAIQATIAKIRVRVPKSGVLFMSSIYAVQLILWSLQMAFKRFGRNAVGCCLRHHRKACEQVFTDDA